MKIYKALKLSCLFLVLFCSSNNWLCAYDEQDFFPSDGEDELQRGLDLTRDIIKLSQEIVTSPNSSSFNTDKYQSTRMLKLIGIDKIKTSFGTKMNRVKRLNDHANLKLHYALKNEEIAMRHYYNRVSRLRCNQEVLAETWRNSPTGKRDGRYWHQLTEPEKEVMRKRYVRYHNPEVFEDKRSPNLIIPESEYAMAWEIKNMSSRGVPSWKKLRDFEKKNNFRKSYHSYKLAQLLPQIDASEEELTEAWEIAQLGTGNQVNWADISSPSVSKKFRDKYIELVQKNGDVIEGHVSENAEMLASVNYNTATR